MSRPLKEAEFVGVVFPRELLMRIDAKSAKRNWNRSQTVVELVRQALDTKPTQPVQVPPQEEESPVLTLREIELRAIKTAIDRNGGDRRAAAVELGISTKMLSAKVPRNGGFEALSAPKSPKRHSTKGVLVTEQFAIDLGGVPSLPDDVAQRIAEARTDQMSEEDELAADRTIETAMSVMRERRLAELRSRK